MNKPAPISAAINKSFTSVQTFWNALPRRRFPKWKRATIHTVTNESKMGEPKLKTPVPIIFAITIPQAVKKPTVRRGDRKCDAAGSEDLFMLGSTMAFARLISYSLDDLYCQKRPRASF